MQKGERCGERGGAREVDKVLQIVCVCVCPYATFPYVFVCFCMLFVYAAAWSTRETWENERACSCAGREKPGDEGNEGRRDRKENKLRKS